jgi:hypothetical protein
MQWQSAAAIRPRASTPDELVFEDIQHLRVGPAATEL